MKVRISFEQVVPEGHNTVEQAAEKMSYSAVWVRKLVARGDLPVVVIAGKKYITDDAIKEYTETHTRRKTSKPSENPEGALVKGIKELQRVHSRWFRTFECETTEPLYKAIALLLKAIKLADKALAEFTTDDDAS